MSHIIATDLDELAQRGGVGALALDGIVPRAQLVLERGAPLLERGELKLTRREVALDGVARLARRAVRRSRVTFRKLARRASRSRGDA